MAVTAVQLLTIEEYVNRPPDGRQTELIQGEIVEMTVPTPRHGEICVQTSYLLRRYLEDHPTGRVTSNDGGVVTGRDPDTLRRADVAYYSFEKVPVGPLPQGYLDVVPELIFEIRSPNDRWTQIHAKVAEYLTAGVFVVCVLDEPSQSAHVFSQDDAPRIVTAEDELTFPEVLDQFSVRVDRFFE